MPTSVLFSGHMVDKLDRSEPRFPSGLVPAVRQRLQIAIESLVKSAPDNNIVGFASCARGGDILFHEQCRAYGIGTVIVLPFQPEAFIRTSVALSESDAGNWIRRFRQIWFETPETDREVMDLPLNGDAFTLCNERLLARAAAHGDVHLIALWDGQRADGNGGTKDMIALIQGKGTTDIFSPQGLKLREV